ncbi:MAG: glycosyl hydrolase family 3, partial [Prochlorococcaceae cyanobacterium]
STLAGLPEQGRTDADPWQAASPDAELARELVTATLEARGRVRPLPAGGAGVNLIRVDQAMHAPFLPTTAPALSAAAAAGFRPCLLAGDTASLWNGDAEAPLSLERLGEGPVLVQLFVRGNPFRGHAAVQEPWGAALRQLLRADRLAGLVVYGSPYLWQQLLPLLPPEVPAAYSPGQMPLAQQSVLAALGVERGADGGFTD